MSSASRGGDDRLVARVNALLDQLPHPWLGAPTRRRATFGALGLAGFHAALIVSLGLTLWIEGSLLVVGALGFVSGASFYVYAHARRALTGEERLVLLEQVWFAQLAAAAFLAAIDAPVARYLDIVAVSLCVFLAAGRLGCTLVGCCHGHPSTVGIVYGASCAEAGFERALVGVRLFPVALIEGAGLLLIGAVGAAMAGLRAPGTAWAWFLVAYAVMRFGLERLRGDARPYALGLSVAQWMSVAELAAAATWWRGLATPADRLALIAVGAAAAATLAVRRLRDPWPRRLARPHVDELRRSALASTAGPTRALGRTSREVSFLVSDEPDGWLVSLGTSSMALMPLCEVAVRAFPELRSESGWTDGAILVFRVPKTPSIGDPASARSLFGSAVREFQHGRPPLALASPPIVAPSLLDIGLPLGAGRAGHAETPRAPDHPGRAAP